MTMIVDSMLIACLCKLGIMCRYVLKRCVSALVDVFSAQGWKVMDGQASFVSCQP
jgi:hypothetical protein